MATAEHCRKVLPRITAGMAPVQVECPICLSLWLWEANQWRQITWAERQSLPAGEEVGV